MSVLPSLFITCDLDCAMWFKSPHNIRTKVLQSLSIQNWVVIWLKRVYNFVKIDMLFKKKKLKAYMDVDVAFFYAK